MIPTYPEHECREKGPCSESPEKHCADCKIPIPNFDGSTSIDHRYRNMGGNGFKSHTADHNHLRSVKGSTGIMPVQRELCVECYLKDYAKAYPDAELPRYITRKV